MQRPDCSVPECQKKKIVKKSIYMQEFTKKKLFAKFSANVHDPTRAISDLKIAAYSFLRRLFYVKARKPTHRRDKICFSLMHTIYQTSLYHWRFFHFNK